MKDFFYRIMSISLALLVLASTASFAVDKHFCGDHLVDVAFFGKADSCPMEASLKLKYGADHDVTMDCCKEELLLIKGQDELKLQFEENVPETIFFLPIINFSSESIFEDLEQVTRPLDEYPPPLILKDYQAFYEQYLI